MALKKIKKSASSLTGLVMSLLIVFGLFTGMFLFLQDQAENSSVDVDTKYNQTYKNLTAQVDDLDDNVQDIKDNFADIKEAESTWQVAWNGMKGLGNTLKLPISFVSTTIGTYNIIEKDVDIIPTWVKTLIILGITAFVVFLVLAIIKGEPKL